MPRTATNEPTRRDLPRLVELARILLWLQYYLTMAGLLGVVLVGGLAASRGPLPTEFSDWVITLMFVLVALAVVFGAGSKLWWRGWAWVYLVVALAELGAVAAAVYLLRGGWYFGLGGIVSVALTVWAMITLVRGEVRRFFFR
jgi:hypothetical protein